MVETQFIDDLLLPSVPSAAIQTNATPFDAPHRRPSAPICVPKYAVTRVSVQVVRRRTVPAFRKKTDMAKEGDEYKRGEQGNTCDAMRTGMAKQGEEDNTGDPPGDDGACNSTMRDDDLQDEVSGRSCDDDSDNASSPSDNFSIRKAEAAKFEAAIKSYSQRCVAKEEQCRRHGDDIQKEVTACKLDREEMESSNTSVKA